jgi:hypothetical protein
MNEEKTLNKLRDYSRDLYDVSENAAYLMGDAAAAIEDLLNECDQYRAALQRLKDHVGPDGRKIIDAALARSLPC